VVLANPPYSIKTWNREMFAHDKWGRNFLGVPPQGRADYAFFQHILASMDEENGRCAILFPHGVLFRKEEAELRKNLVESDLVECVIGIGRNLFFNSCMDACIIICRKNKGNKRNKVLFINAKEEVTRKNAESYLEPKHIEKIKTAYESFTDIDNFAKVASKDDILANNAKLSIALYVKCNNADDDLDSEECINSWIKSTPYLNGSLVEFLEMIEHEDK
jgi:type I restriction enzyme M protein